MNSRAEKERLKKRKKPKENGKDELYKKNLQKCFLCDEVLFNNYEVLVHNARHIIIPVQKYECHQCRECLTLFITKQELYLHVLNGHPEIINATNDELMHEPVNIKLDDKSTMNISNKVLVNGIDKVEETAIDCITNDLLLVSRGIALNTSAECITDDLPLNDKEIVNTNLDYCKRNNVKQETETIVLDDSDDESKVDMLSVIENMVKRQPIILCKTPIQINNETAKINVDNAFENKASEPSNKIVLQNFVDKNCVVVCTAEEVKSSLKVGSDFSVLNNDSPVKSFSNTVSSGMKGTPLGLKDKIVFEDDIDEFYQDDNLLLCQRFLIGSKKPEMFSPSIHFDDLMVPDYYKCRYCEHVSKNRYESVVHDMVHIKTKTRIRGLLCVTCDRIIAGNHHILRRHIEASHPNSHITSRLKKYHKCRKCGLNFHCKVKHMKLYHNQYGCYKCKERFLKRSTLKRHLKNNCATRKLQRVTGENVSHTGGNIGHTGENGGNTGEKLVFTGNAEPETRTERLVKMCEVCFMLRKQSVQRKYIYLDTISDIGKSQECYQCHKKTFSIRLVKMVMIRRKGWYLPRTSKWKSRAMAKIEHNMHKLKYKPMWSSK